MNKKIKLLSVGLVAVVSFFVGVRVVSAQAVTVTNCTSATLIGAVTNTNSVQTSAWFEWGTNHSNIASGAGQKTATQVFGVPQEFTQPLYGLAPGTAYYYRAVVSNIYGTAQGDTLSFSTPLCSTGSAFASVSTSGATSISQNGATLNGYLSSNGANTNAWFEWGMTSSFGNTTNNTSYGSTATNFSNSIYGLNSNTTYYYRAVAQNGQGLSYGSTISFTTAGDNGNNYYNNCGSWGWGSNCGNSLVMVSTRNADTSSQFAVLNGYIDPNNTNDTTRWFEWGGSQSLGNATQKLSHGSVASNFSTSLTGLVPNTTYYYRAAGRNSQGAVYGNILSFTTGNDQTSRVIGVAPTVNTLLSTELTGTTAKLNGLVFSTASQSSNAWFEWGTNSNLGSKTQSVSVGNLSVVKHSDFITGLTPGQTYYYRIVAENPYGKVYGLVNTFVSEVNTPVVDTVVTTPVVLRSTATTIGRGSSSLSPVALSIEGGAEMIGGGEKRTYHIVWKNEVAKSLKNVVLRVSFPQSMSIESATKGTFSSADNSVVVDIKTLAPREGGDDFIFATAGRGLKAGEVLMVTANMVYTGTNGVQGDAIAYVMHRAEFTQSALGANVFNAGEFIPTTLFEWMLLLILVLVFVLLSNHLYGRFSGGGHH